MSTLSSDGKYNATRRSHFTVAIVPAAMSMHTKCAANPCTPVSPSIPQLIPLTMDRKMKLLHRKRRTRVSLRAVASREHASREYATETINRARDPRPSARSPRPNPSMRCASKRTNDAPIARERATYMCVFTRALCAMFCAFTTRYFPCASSDGARDDDTGDARDVEFMHHCARCFVAREGVATRRALWGRLNTSMRIFVTTARTALDLVPRRRVRAMEPSVRALIESLHASRTRAVVSVTGGGTRALGWLTSVPNCSKTLINAHVPYDTSATESLLGRDVDKYVERSVAIALAEAAYVEAVRGGCGRRLEARDARALAGVAATCALGTGDVVKRGQHRCFVAAKSSGRLATYEMVLNKASGRDRFAEDACASRLVLRALHDEAWRRAREDGCALTAGENAGVDLVGEVLSESEMNDVVVTYEEEPAYACAGATPRDVVERWLEDDSPSAPAILEFMGGELTCAGATRANVVLSGSFNPLHDGHRELLAAAAATKPPGAALAAYEIGVVNADKGALTVDEILRRLAQFSTPGVVCLLTKAPLFVDKTKAAPGATFVVGVDTAVRLLDPKYHGGELGLGHSLDVIRKNNCDFIVAGRFDAQKNAFIDPNDIDVPLAARSAFSPLPSFRNDLSSTAIRAAAATPSPSPPS